MTPRPIVLAAAMLATLAPALAQPANDRPGDAQPPEPRRTPQAKQAPRQAANAKLPSLVEKGPDGKVLPLDQPIAWAALRRNPTITPDDWQRLEPVMTARRTECEAIVLRNLDIIENIEAGALDALDGDVRQRINIARDMLKPLRAEGGDFIVKIAKEGHLTDEQSRASQAMQGQYITALRGQYRAELVAKGVPPADFNSELLHRQQLIPVDETLGCHRMLRDEASRNLERALTALTWPTETLAALEPQRAELAANPDDEARAELFRAILAKLTVSQRRELFAAVIGSRPKP